MRERHGNQSMTETCSHRYWAAGDVDLSRPVCVPVHMINAKNDIVVDPASLPFAIAVEATHSDGVRLSLELTAREVMPRVAHLVPVAPRLAAAQ